MFRRAAAVVFCVLAMGSFAYAENWPGFRGPTGQGLSTEVKLPEKWTGMENVAWKTEVAGSAWSSPVVWQDKVFVTTATGDGAGCHVVCLDRRGGKVLWDQEVFRQDLRRKEDKNSFASSTPVVDAERVYAVFGDGGIAALSHAGEVVWTNREVKFYSKHGLGASPVLFADLLIMPFDGSSDGDDKEIGWKKPWDQSFVLALDKANGKTRWRGLRGMSRIAHVTPLLFQVDGQQQLISGAGDVIQGFDPHDGRRLWSLFSQGEGVVPSLASGAGLVFSCSGFEKPTIRAVRPGTWAAPESAKIEWEYTKAVPSLSSLLCVEPYLYAVTDGGVASCLEASTGKSVWQNRLEGNYSASPVYGDGKIYFLSESGEMVVVAPGPEFKILARNPLGERCQASPAVSQGQVFIRTEKSLFCIGK